MEGGEGMEAVELRSRIDSNERQSILQFPTANTVVSVDIEGFTGDVINFVNGAAIDEFNAMEDFAAKTFSLEDGEDRLALTRGVDNVYHRIQDKLDSSLRGWETLLQERYFNNPLPNQEMDCNLSSASENKQPEDLDLEEQHLDSELNILRNQLISARREGAKLHRELNTVEKQLALRMEVWSEVKSLDESVEEVLKSAFLLKNSIIKANKDSYGKTIVGATHGGTNDGFPTTPRYP